MAFPCSFDQSNFVLSAPPGMEESVDCLSVAMSETSDGHPTVISCYRLSKNELDEVNRTGRIWLGVLGNSHPPVWVSGESPFR